MEAKERWWRIFTFSGSTNPPWRHIETEEPGQMKLENSVRMKVLGHFWLLIGLIGICVSLNWMFLLLDWLPLAYRMGDYRVVIGLFSIAGAFSLLSLESVFIGVWTAFGRTVITLNNAAWIVSKEIKLGSVCIYRRDFNVADLSSISCGRATGISRFLDLSSVRLNFRAGRSRTLFQMHRKFDDETKRLAGKTAEFLGVPCTTG